MILTIEQRNVVTHRDEAFVGACPGAGKTRTVLARMAHLYSILPPRRGLAFVSFTNKAVEEFKARANSLNLSHVLQFPGYVGTFDGFVRHFMFLPGGSPGGVRPQVIDSWATIDAGVRLQGRNSFRGPAMTLDAFNSETAGIDSNRIGNAALRRHVEGHIAEYAHAAERLHRGLNGRGFFSTSDVRRIALERIREANWGAALGRALAARFAEIMVDEAQDCNPSDLEILQWLRRSGVRVTCVCDMDQSIFEFRNGTRARIEEFAGTYEAQNRLPLTGNFRSSPAICRLAASLRNEPDHVDEPVGWAKETTHPIAVYAFTGRTVTAEIGRWLIDHAASPEIGIPRSDLIILAHSERAARLAAGGFGHGGAAASRIDTLARAVNQFWTGTTRYNRNNALGSIERLLLALSGRLRDPETVLQASQRLGLNMRLLRRQALDLVTRLPPSCRDTDDDRAAWVELARQRLRDLGVEALSGRGVAMLLPVRGKEWAENLEQADHSTGLRYSTIHNAKGGEYRGVCVVIPPDDARKVTTELIEMWERRRDHEAKRVIYVGVTRAQHLAALAMPVALRDRCTSILDAACVPYRIHE